MLFIKRFRCYCSDFFLNQTINWFVYSSVLYIYISFSLQNTNSRN